MCGLFIAKPINDTTETSEKLLISYTDPIPFWGGISHKTTRIYNSFIENISCKFIHVWSCLFCTTGKIGGFIASIPEVMVAGLLCFMWAMLTAWGLSNLRYSEAGSSRNIIIVGLSLFFSLSVPAYFQQYGISPNSNVSVPSYFQPYIVASHGPFHSKYGGVCHCHVFHYYDLRSPLNLPAPIFVI